MTELAARIPERIVYVCRAPITVSLGWDDLPDRGDPIEVTPAYPVDPDGRSDRRENATRWAERGQWPPRPAAEGGAEEAWARNEPIPTIRVVNLDVRSEGGRAYKVVLPVGPGNLYVDLREDVFLDAMLAKGVAPGGTLTGPFVWVVVGSQTKLVRVGSALHDRVLVAHARSVAKTLAAGALEPGGVYRNRKGEYFVYLGVCDTDEILWDHPVDAEGRPLRREPKVARHTPRLGVQMWFEVPAYALTGTPTDAAFQREFDDTFGPPERPTYDPAWFRVQVVKKKTAVERAGTVRLPPDVWTAVRTMGTVSCQRFAAKELASETQHLALTTARPWYRPETPIHDALKKTGALPYHVSSSFALTRLARSPGTSCEVPPDYAQPGLLTI